MKFKNRWKKRVKWTLAVEWGCYLGECVHSYHRGGFIRNQVRERWGELVRRRGSFASSDKVSSQASHPSLPNIFFFQPTKMFFFKWAGRSSRSFQRCGLKRKKYFTFLKKVGQKWNSKTDGKNASNGHQRSNGGVKWENANFPPLSPTQQPPNSGV